VCPALTPLPAPAPRAPHGRSLAVHTRAWTSASRLAPKGTVGALLRAAAIAHPPSCPAFPRPGFAARRSRGRSRFGTMRALTSAGLAPNPTDLSASSALPSRRPAPNHVMRPNVAFTVTTARPARSRLRHTLAGSPRHAAESGSSSCGPQVRVRLLPTPPRGDAVTFRFMRRDFTWQGLPPC
jgi:hypothetical protein